MEEVLSAEAEETEPENCCLGLLEVNANIVLSAMPNNPTAVKYFATVQVTTITKCLDIKCEGTTWVGLSYFSCDNEVETFNDIAGSTIKGDGFRVPMEIYFEGACKLGCCDHPCPNRYKTITHLTTGIVPKRGAGKAVTSDLASKFGFGGDTPPTFRPCCKKKKPAEASAVSTSESTPQREGNLETGSSGSSSSGGSSSGGSSSGGSGGGSYGGY